MHAVAQRAGTVGETRGAERVSIFPSLRMFPLDESVISYRINNVMKVLTIISVMMLPLTLISGIYGMNIMLPGENHPWAFPVILAVMGIIAVGMLTFFKIKNWL